MTVLRCKRSMGAMRPQASVWYHSVAGRRIKPLSKVLFERSGAADVDFGIAMGVDSTEGSDWRLRRRRSIDGDHFFPSRALTL